jgi:hypothetical protein
MTSMRNAPLLLLAAASLASAQSITTPKQELGHNFGDDYYLANYKQLSAYWQKLARQSNRMKLVDIGKTAEGRTQYMAIVSSPANLANLERYRSISARLAKAEGLTDAQARALAKEGKAVVWIDGGLHATEVLGAQQLGEMIYQMVSRTDEETMRFLNDVVILFVHANPDGNDLVSDWYMRNPDTLARSTSDLPKLYQKYIGHDNNRDFFGSTQAETENINRVLYWQWFPQILYNHHQSGPAGTIVYSPPLRDPYNYNLDAGIIVGLQSLGAAMNTRLIMQGKGGLTQRTGASYDGWWNGGIRNTATFHNTIAMLTEMIGGPTPQRVPLVLNRQIPQADLALPIAPQEWHFRQSIDYSIELNRAVLNYASRNREDLLYNIYRMGRASIERGSRDTWTANPRRDAAIAAASAGVGSAGVTAGGRGGRGGAASAAADSALWAKMHQPAMRDARGYVIPSSQADFGTATKFVNALLEVGITVNRATAPFNIQGKQYPAGSYVVKTNQAFRPHILDMFEPQMHPDVIPYPGASPTPPYDIAGWTLAYQMGVEFDRILDDFTGPFQKITVWNTRAPNVVALKPNMVGYSIDRHATNSFIAVNRLMKNGADVRELQNGDFYVRANAATAPTHAKLLDSLGLTFVARDAEPAGMRRLGPARVGLWDQYGGSMDAGWARWILEQFEYPFDRVFAPQLDAGNLNAKYSTLIFVDGSLPAVGGGGGRGAGRGGAGAAPRNVPAEYQAQLGRVTAETTYPKLKEFMENGGTIVAIGQAGMNLAEWLKLPVGNHLVDAAGVPLPTTKFYVPGSLLDAVVDTTHPLGRGMRGVTTFFFERSPVFKILPGGESTVEKIAWFDTATPLVSGWALGQENLQGGITALRAQVGNGYLVMYGPEILQRAQPHGTFNLLFNAIY